MTTDGDPVPALHDLGGDGPALLFCHPTGFHALTWAPVAAHLRDVAHCWAIDFRGHGDSLVPPSGDLSWNAMAADVEATVARLRDDHGAATFYGVGHSMGGAALFLSEEDHPGTWAGLWCYEPIVFPPMEGTPPTANPLAEAARKRRPGFPSKEAARLNYARKPPLDRIDPEALALYVDHGFRELPDGTVGLKCAPEVEAAVFENGRHHDAWFRLAGIRCPVVVCASGDGAPPSQVAALVANQIPGARLERFPQLSHFGPMEDPATIAASIRALLVTHP